jgi:hypothetical protein
VGEVVLPAILFHPGEQIGKACEQGANSLAVLGDEVASFAVFVLALHFDCRRHGWSPVVGCEKWQATPLYILPWERSPGYHRVDVEV